jgi:hypothetical protein
MLSHPKLDLNTTAENGVFPELQVTIFGKLLSLEDFQKLIIKSCTAETSVDKDNWTKENPLYGHCAVVSLLTQKFFGGEIIEISLAGTPFPQTICHFYNLFNGIECDLTVSQFGGWIPDKNIDKKLIPPSELLDYPDTLDRTAKLFLSCYYYSVDSRNVALSELIKNQHFIERVRQILT